ncbi:MAG TPA: methyltransferase domain-containing protein [bacterium]|nr:methyltransferase domain-containing protein [bacterium]
MKPRLQRRVQRYGWDKAADCYEELWGRQIEPSRRLLLERAALQPGEHVLDVACGSGLVTFPAADRVGPGGRVLGTDLSDEMVRRSSGEASRRGLAHVSFERMDAEELGVADASFDAVLCALGLMYVPDPVTACREMARVLRPGGRAVVAVWGERRRCGWADIFPIVDGRVNTDVCPLFFRLGTGDTLRFEMEAAGWEDVRLERIDATLEYADADEAVSAAFRGGPVALAYDRFDEATRASAHAEYLESIAPFRRNGSGYAIPGEFVVATAYRAGQGTKSSANE